VDDTRRDTETSTSRQLIRRSYVEKGKCCTGTTIAAASFSCLGHIPCAPFSLLAGSVPIHRVLILAWRQQVFRHHLAILFQTFALATHDRTQYSKVRWSTNLSLWIRQQVYAAKHSLR
jgi:hypothetical protein